jgi:PPOX class probable F420-dependent enzyme
MIYAKYQKPIRNPARPRQAGQMAKMTEDDMLAFLAEGAHTGKLATASPAGAPHVAPVWFVVDGRDLVFTTHRETLKGRHLLANPRAALAADSEAYPHTFVTVRGPVTLEETAADLVDWATRLAARYVPAGQAESYGKRNGVPGEMLCRLHIERLTGERAVAV